jgi:hypothetical protein
MVAGGAAQPGGAEQVLCLLSHALYLRSLKDLVVSRLLTNTYKGMLCICA